jgi:hypothetical protein
MPVDIKNIPSEELKVAVKSLNEILEEGKIKTVAKAKVDIVENFVKKITELSEAEKVDTIPDPAIDFFNKYFTDEEPDAETPKTDGKAEEKPSGKKGGKSTPKKAPGAAKVDKPKKDPKPPKEKVYTRENSVADAFKKGGSLEEIAKVADALYVKNGGKENLDQSTRLLHKCFKFSTCLGIIKTVDGKHSLTI